MKKAPALNLTLYGLLHVCEDARPAANLPLDSITRQIEIYARNAVTLAKSLRPHDIAFTLLTNDLVRVSTLLGSDNLNYLSLQEIPCSTKLPQDTYFFSAHFKMDLFRHLATLPADYVGMCDLDMICLNDPPPALLQAVRKKTPLWYDISDQVLPAYGSATVTRDLSLVLAAESEGRWAGGEFLTGPPEFFAALVHEVDQLLGNYRLNITTINDVSDEPLTSAALERLRAHGRYIPDAGLLGIVGRYWSIDTLHPQKPFAYFADCFLLHLPADKTFLAGMAGEQKVDKQLFMKNYVQRRRASTMRWEKIVGALRRLFGLNCSAFAYRVKR